MNKKLGRYLEPASWVFFVILGVFVVAAAAFQNFFLAGCEAVLTILLLVLYLRQRKQRKAVLQNYLQSALAIPEAGTPALPPFPTVMVRMADGVITCGGSSRRVHRPDYHGAGAGIEAGLA